ncbi:MAG: hypothetical protein M1833_003228 [Piccolia ochrophora]|nr:MAG: hypothetical protein M1833_003228 [Piccolia ochrophora]
MAGEDVLHSFSSVDWSGVSSPPSHLFNGPPQGCPFLDRLPLEIRFMVYIQVFSDYFKEQFRRSNKLNRGQLRSYFAQFDCTLFALGSLSLDLPSGHDPTKASGLLQTCNQIYAEAHSLFYTAISLHVRVFRDSHQFLRFTEVVSPRLLAAIHRLHLTWTKRIPQGPKPVGMRIEEWCGVFHAIASKMPNLRALRITVEYAPSTLKCTPDQTWVKALLELRGLAQYEMNLEGPSKKGLGKKGRRKKTLVSESLESECLSATRMQQLEQDLRAMLVRE